ncbi:hypothetical protein VTK73DRAFT_5614 [Phialemonium thermophilum]|uniref:Zn(2)-C6 fungal-type domain-containing protein n=1 Tax=Phialemonium thermophilum TaxID=223376 RepID=A0ABR3WMH6_9PEZI
MADDRSAVHGGPVKARSVKRPRPVKSCAECRSRKLKCDRLNPCSQCQKSRRVCVYSSLDQVGAPDPVSGPDQEAGDSRPKRPRHSLLTSPEHEGQSYQFENVVVSATANPGSVEAGTGGQETIADKRLLESRSPAADSRSSRRRHGARVAAPAMTIRSLSVKGELRTRYVGQNSTKVLLNLFSDARDFMNNMAKRDSVRGLFYSLQDVYRALQHDHKRALEPITVYVDSMMPIQKRMGDVLPKRAACDRLLEAYIGVSEGLYRVIHVPTFRKEYEEYWEGRRCCETFLPRLLTMMSIGSRFDTDSRGMGHDRSDSVHAPTACALVRSWLDGLRGKQLVDIHTLQTEVLLLHAQKTIAPRHQDAWTQLGLVVRMAMSMGLHRDPSEFPQLTPFQAETRRRLWYTIMDMDLHLSLAASLPCATREGEYTCRPPRNVNDEDLYPEMKELPPSKPFDHFTDSLLQAYAAKTLPVRLRATNIVNRLEWVRDYTEVLEVGSKLERLLDDINCLFPRHHALDTQRKFKEWRIRALLDIHVRRPLLGLYRPFAMGSTSPCPARISTSYLKSSMLMLTYMDELDHTIPGFQDVKDMYLVVLKHDIIQAAFSLCYYIMVSPENVGPDIATKHSGSPKEPSPSPTSGTSDDSSAVEPIWSVPTLVERVEKTIENCLAQIRDPSCDLRDIVALSIVLNSVQAGTWEQKFERITAGIRKIIDICRPILKMPQGHMSSLSITPAATVPVETRGTPSMFGGTSMGALPMMQRDWLGRGNLDDAAQFLDSFLDYWNPTPPTAFTPRDQT